MPPSRRAHYHRQIAQRLERGHGEPANELAAELALHFEKAHLPKVAIHYFRQAARNLARRYANREAAAALAHGLELLPLVADAERMPLYLQLREQRGLLYRSMGNISAALETSPLGRGSRRRWRQAAAGQGALVQAGQLYWFDTERCLERLDEAFTLSRDLPDKTAHKQVMGYRGFVRVVRQRWSDEDADACVTAALASGTAGDDTLSWSSHAAYIMVARAQYRSACDVAREGVARALRAGNISEYLTLHLNWGSGLILSRRAGPGGRLAKQRPGDCGEERASHVGRCAAPMRGARQGKSLRLRQARDLAEQTLAFAQEDPEVRKTPLLMSRVALGYAYRGLGDPERALRHLTSMPSFKDQDLEAIASRAYALCECWLALGDTARAAQEAGRLIQFRTTPGHRTLLALAQCMVARVEMALGSWAAA